MSSMDEFNSLKDSIQLDGETVFYHHLKQDKEKLAIFNQAVKDGKISDFDPFILTRLKKLFYAFFSGLIYMYNEPTNFHNIGDKADLMTFVFTDREYSLVKGYTDSIRAIPFFMYEGIEHLDIDIWFLVKEGHREWVYDLFSMLKIEKSIFDKLEHPEIIQVYSKNSIENHPGYDKSSYQMYSSFFDFMMISFFEKMEKKMDKHPFKHILGPEVSRYKQYIDLEGIALEWAKEKQTIKGKTF